MDYSQLTTLVAFLVAAVLYLGIRCIASERQTRRTLAIVVSRLRDCERRLDWWVANGVVDLNDGQGPHRQGFTGNTLAHLHEGGQATEFDPPPRPGTARGRE